MTAGDMTRPTARRPLSRELLRHHAAASRQRGNRQAVLLFLCLTFIWVGVLWMAIFGSRPHTYLLILVGTYTVGVLSGTGISGLLLRHNKPKSTTPPEPSAEPIDAEIRPVG